MIYSIDIETENEGIDVFNGVIRILSIQIGDDNKQEVYYADARLRDFKLEQAKLKIEKLLDEGHSFAGYNIKGFDIPILQKFHGIVIPASKIIDVMESKEILALKQRIGWNRLPLEKACEAYGIGAEHKRLMEKESEKYRNKTQLIAEAEVYARQIMMEKGWSRSFSMDYVLRSLTTKHAITQTYREFIRLDGERNTLFYRYAVGDIICEHRLFKAISK